MSAGYQELFLDQGADFATTITLDDVNGDPYDLTDFSAKSQMKKSYYSTNSIAEFNVNIVGLPSDGIISLSLNHAVTANIAPGRYVYDVAMKNNNDNTVTRVLEGIINVTPMVSKI